MLIIYKDPSVKQNNEYPFHNSTATDFFSQGPPIYISEKIDIKNKATNFRDKAE
jgi:hypothetical protein